MVNVLIGQDSQLSYFIGSPGAGYPNICGSAQWIGLVTNHTVKENEGRRAIQYLNGMGSRDIDAFLNEKPTYDGTITYYLQNGRILAYAIGSSTDTGSPNYLHTISETGGQLRWFELQDIKGSPADNTNFTRQIAGCMVSKLKISGKQGQPIEATLDYVAGSITFSTNAGSAISLIDSGTVPYMWSMAQVYLSGAAATTVAGVLSEVTDFDWTIDNTLDNNTYYLNNTRWKGQSIPGTRKYIVNLTVNLTSATGGNIYNQFYKTGSQLNATIFFLRTSGADTTSTADTFRMYLSGISIMSMDQPTPAVGTQTQKIELQPTSTTIVVRDAVTAYPIL